MRKCRENSFDGYNYISLKQTLKDVVLNPNKKMCHTFVLVMLLEGAIIVRGDKTTYNPEKLTN